MTNIPKSTDGVDERIFQVRSDVDSGYYGCVGAIGFILVIVLGVVLLLK